MDEQREGFASFASNYVNEAFLGQVKYGEAYLTISYERRAYATDANMRDFLVNTTAGRAIAAKLANGEPLSDEDRKAIDAYIVDKASQGTLKPGFQFVNGQLIYVRPPR